MQQYDHPLFICKIIENFKNIQQYACRTRPTRGRKAGFEILHIYADTYEICKICHLGALPRVRLAARRSTSAVDIMMFARETDVTFTLFSSGNAQHAVLRKWGLRLC